MKVRVNTIYPAFMGEVNKFGIGAPCTFVRLAGCLLRCYKDTKGFLCDTPEALERNSGIEMTYAEVVEEVKKIGYPLVCLTGGEPLWQGERSLKLLRELTSSGVNVVVETSGAVSLKRFVRVPRVSFVLDVKSPSTGENSKMITDNYSLLLPDDYVKFVLDDNNDLEFFTEWVRTYGSNCQATIAVGLFWGSKISYEELMNFLREHKKLGTFFLNMQTHKLCCMYDQIGRDVLKKIFIPREL